MDSEKRLTLNLVMEKDPNGGYSGYFKEFPQALAEGETKDELFSNLFKSIAVLNKMNAENIKGDFEFKKFELAVA